MFSPIDSAAREDKLVGVEMEHVIEAGYHEKRLLHHLLDNYNVLERPVVNESDPLQLSFGLTLMQIIDVQQQQQQPVPHQLAMIACLEKFAKSLSITLEGGRKSLTWQEVERRDEKNQLLITNIWLKLRLLAQGSPWSEGPPWSKWPVKESTNATPHGRGRRVATSKPARPVHVYGTDSKLAPSNAHLLIASTALELPLTLGI
uniref:Neurotransmitter-gated ion-channel ligand-binding domain-containing protein n=1 Tax=Anopheles atroparvus TaxID=41427 RepID=A0A182J1W0_ANOAO